VLEEQNLVTQRREATTDDLYHVPENGKAEIVHGELALLGPTEVGPGYAAGEVFVSLREYARSSRTGRAIGDNKAFIVALPHRKSFSSHAAFYTGAPAGMGFFQEAPVFAVEVRGADDYGATVDAQRAAKRADYFTAGTLVVWDIDLLSEDAIKVYRSHDRENATTYRRGGIAEAEPAVHGWRFPVDNLFETDEPEQK
jgi:Uma2 family endonuclease